MWLNTPWLPSLKVGGGAKNNAFPNKLHNLNYTAITDVNLLKPTGYVMHQQFNVQQLYALPKLYLCVLYLSENKKQLVALTA